VIDWWERSQSLPDQKTGTGTLIGTRWSHFDLYQHIIDNLSDEVDAFIRSAYNADGTAYYPELLSLKELDRLRKTTQSKIFSAFYLNDPVDIETQLVKSEYLHTYPGLCRACGKEHKLPKDGEMTKFVGCDPAVSMSKTADFSAIVSVGVDLENTVWVIGTQNGRFSTQEVIERLFSTNKDVRPAGMSVEVIGQAQMLLSQIHEQENQRNEYLPIEEIKTRAGEAKEARLRSILQTRFERGKIMVRNDMIDLLAQLSTYPSSKHDDLLDALSDAIAISYKPDTPKEEEKTPVTMQERVDWSVQHSLDDVIDDPVLGTNF